jgi:hypothetical protein
MLISRFEEINMLEDETFEEFYTENDYLHFKRNGKDPVRQYMRGKIVTILMLRQFCPSFNTNRFLSISFEIEGIHFLLHIRSYS